MLVATDFNINLSDIVKKNVVGDFKKNFISHSFCAFNYVANETY